jgi:hypothetical protein
MWIWGGGEVRIGLGGLRLLLVLGSIRGQEKNDNEANDN